MWYWVWFDDNAKKTTEDKIKEAMVGYHERYLHEASLCLVNVAELVPLSSKLTLKSAPFVHLNTYYFAIDMPVKERELA